MKSARALKLGSGLSKLFVVWEAVATVSGIRYGIGVDIFIVELERSISGTSYQVRLSIHVCNRLHRHEDHKIPSGTTIDL